MPSFLMEDSIVIYTMSACKYCKMVKELMERAGFEYVEIKLGKDATKQQILEVFDKESITFPQVVFKGQQLGGLVETAKYFQSQGFV